MKIKTKVGGSCEARSRACGGYSVNIEVLTDTGRQIARMNLCREHRWELGKELIRGNPQWNNYDEGYNDGKREATPERHEMGG